MDNVKENPYSFTMKDIGEIITKLVDDHSRKPEPPSGTWSILGTMPEVLNTKRFRSIEKIQLFKKKNPVIQTTTAILTDSQGRYWFTQKETAIEKAIDILNEREWILDVKIIEN